MLLLKIFLEILPTMAQRNDHHYVIFHQSCLQKIIFCLPLWESLPYSWDEMQWISTIIMLCGLLTQENIAQCKRAPIHTVQGLVLVFDGCQTGRPAIQMLFYFTNVTAMQTPIGSLIYVIKRESLSGSLHGCPSRD